MTILWWHWLVLGLVLALAELAAAGGFYIIFFGFAALVVGMLAALGLAEALWLQLVLFSGLSVSSLVLFRSRLLRWLQVDPKMPSVDTFVDELAVAAEDLAPGGTGKIELRGASWSARNTGSSTIVRGARCRVLRVDGLTMDVILEGVRT